MMEIINFADRPSLVSRYMRELRDVNIQNDPLRFRSNLRRIGQIMAYEISKRLDYSDVGVQTPLGPCVCQEPADKLVIATILRAGLPFHEGFLSYFDRAENAFVSAYRKYREKGDSFDVLVEYLASPSIEGKTLLLVDPMLATGSSVIASQAGVDYVSEHFPQERTTVWCGAIDPEINAHSYIVPGLGDAGDLAYGEKS